MAHKDDTEETLEFFFTLDATPEVNEQRLKGNVQNQMKTFVLATKHSQHLRKSYWRDDLQFAEIE